MAVISNPATDIASTKAGQIAIIIVVIAIVVIIFIFVNKYIKGANSILESLGLKNSKEEEKLNNDIASASKLSINVFAPSYYKSVKSPKLIPESDAKKLAKDIYDSVGYVWDNSTQAAGAIKQLQYKTQVSYLADIFQNQYSRDMKTYLERAFDTDSQKNTLLEIFNYVNNLK
jgi:hypothetical protein